MNNFQVCLLIYYCAIDYCVSFYVLHVFKLLSTVSRCKNTVDSLLLTVFLLLLSFSFFQTGEQQLCH